MEQEWTEAFLNGVQNESLKEILTLVLDWNFVNIGVILLIILITGTGLYRTRLKGVIWGLALAVIWSTLHVGIGRHEWGEVFFNGTLL